MRIIINLLNRLKSQIRNQFGFTKAETNGVLILMVCILVFLTLPYGIQWYHTQTYIPNLEADNALLDSTLALLQKQQINKKENSLHADYTAYLPDKIVRGQEKTKTVTALSRFDINTATPQSLQTLPGIGPTRSARIIKYRDKLGGFVRQEQCQEVYGLDSLAIASIRQHAYVTPNFQPKKININQDSFKALLAHPYLSYEQVQRIVSHRNKKGSFQNLKELRQYNILAQDTFEKIKPYLSV